MCVYVCVCARAGSEKSPQVPSPIEFSLMQPGQTVKVRYASTQYRSSAGDGWRTVVVIGKGHVGETEYGRRSSVHGLLDDSG